MAEYIEREALIKRLEASPIFSNFATGGIFIRDGVIDIIRNQPAADVVEVVHGEWKQNPYCKRIYYCSICGRHIEDCTSNYKENFPYCHCGAKMDAKRECEDG